MPTAEKFRFIRGRTHNAPCGSHDRPEGPESWRPPSSFQTRVRILPQSDWHRWKYLQHRHRIRNVNLRISIPQYSQHKTGELSCYILNQNCTYWHQNCTYWQKVYVVLFLRRSNFVVHKKIDAQLLNGIWCAGRISSIALSMHTLCKYYGIHGNSPTRV